MDDAEPFNPKARWCKARKGERFNAENTEFCSIEQAPFVQRRTIHKQNKHIARCTLFSVLCFLLYALCSLLYALGPLFSLSSWRKT